MTYATVRKQLRFPELAGALACHPGRLDECRVDECRADGARVDVQPGDVHRGCVTSDITGPFEGDPGTSRRWPGPPNVGP